MVPYHQVRGKLSSQPPLPCLQFSSEIFVAGEITSWAKTFPGEPRPTAVQLLGPHFPLGWGGAVLWGWLTSLKESTEKIRDVQGWQRDFNKSRFYYLKVESNIALQHLPLFPTAKGALSPGIFKHQRAKKCSLHCTSCQISGATRNAGRMGPRWWEHHPPVIPISSL